MLEDILKENHPEDIVSYEAGLSKTFQGIPAEWHQTIKVRNPDTQRIKLYFKCMYPHCDSVFKKSCNLRDHFRKHTGQRPFTCAFCNKTFTQSGNLGRHLKNVHNSHREENMTKESLMPSNHGEEKDTHTEITTAQVDKDHENLLMIEQGCEQSQQVQDNTNLGDD